MPARLIETSISLSRLSYISRRVRLTSHFEQLGAPKDALWIAKPAHPIGLVLLNIVLAGVNKWFV